jgi:hypothetical protein
MEVEGSNKMSAFLKLLQNRDTDKLSKQGNPLVYTTINFTQGPLYCNNCANFIENEDGYYWSSIDQESYHKCCIENLKSKPKEAGDWEMV